MIKTFSVIAALCASMLTPVQSQAVSFSSVYAFGDSLSDAGASSSAVLSMYNLLGNHCDASHPCPPYYDGRYSNGKVAVERLADAVLPGGGTAANFHDFAIAGATSGRGNFGDGGSASTTGFYGLPGMYQEIGLYLGMAGNLADPNALYFLWGGANDFLTASSPFSAAQNIANYAGALAAAGAQHILVPNLPNLGLTPFVRDLGMQDLALGYVLGFNNELNTQLNDLSQLFPHSDIIQFDMFSFFNDVVAHPGSYGFSNTTEACLSSLLVPCASPDQYVFWDGFHPSASANQVVASAFAAAIPAPAPIPVPAAAWLLGSGLLGLIGVARRKTA